MYRKKIWITLRKDLRMDRFKILNNFNFSMEYEYNSIILKLYSIWSAILSMRKKKKKVNESAEIFFKAATNLRIKVTGGGDKGRKQSYTSSFIMMKALKTYFLRLQVLESIHLRKLIKSKKIKFNFNWVSWKYIMIYLNKKNKTYLVCCISSKF